jgi:predicted nucleotide-binding protein (sugar kinase/HSP70/actin superfamily)
MIVAGCVAGLVIGFGARVEARPPYKGAFEKQYPEVVKNEGKDGKITCVVCHEAGDDKKKRNNYGEAMAKIIKAKESDADKIKEALEKTEKEKSAIKDKTFGDLLKDGKLPASK